LREKLFCHYMAELGNPREAAVRVGYPPFLAWIKSAMLMERPAIQNALRRNLEKRRRADTERLAVSGLRRLAFSQTNDAVSLALSRDADKAEDISTLDLFCVAGVKTGKDGVELRFFDRIRALEILLGWSRDGEKVERGGSIYAALERSAAALGAGKSGEAQDEV
jgi:hypothetical protein